MQRLRGSDITNDLLNPPASNKETIIELIFCTKKNINWGQLFHKKRNNYLIIQAYSEYYQNQNTY